MRFIARSPEGGRQRKFVIVVTVWSVVIVFVLVSVFLLVYYYCFGFFDRCAMGYGLMPGYFRISATLYSTLRRARQSRTSKHFDTGRVDSPTLLAEKATQLCLPNDRTYSWFSVVVFAAEFSVFCGPSLLIYRPSKISKAHKTNITRTERGN